MTFATTPQLDTLLADGLIRHEQYQAALKQMDELSAEPFSTLGGGLIWLVRQGIVTAEDLEIIQNLADSETESAGKSTSQQALAELEQLLQQASGARQQSQTLHITFPGPSWAWWLGSIGLIAAFAWYLLAPNSTPGCVDKQVKQTLHFQLISGIEKLKHQNPLDSEAAAADPYSLSLSNIQEIGYIKSTRSRACRAKVHMQDQTHEVGYTITPTGKKDTMLIQGADLRLLQARYGQLDDAGEPLAVGQPVGAQQLIAAFEQAAEEFKQQSQQGMAGTNMALERMFQRQRQHRGLPEETDTRSVRNTYPLGNCKQSAPNQWSCRLLAEFRDPMVFALGGLEWQILEGNFDFVQEGSNWRLSEHFAKQYLDATVASRLGLLRGKEAADQFEQLQSQPQDTVEQ